MLDLEKLKNSSHQEARQREPKCPDVGLTFTPIESLAAKVQILRGESLLGQLRAEAGHCDVSHSSCVHNQGSLQLGDSNWPREVSFSRRSFNGKMK